MKLTSNWRLVEGNITRKKRRVTGRDSLFFSPSKGEKPLFRKELTKVEVVSVIAEKKTVIVQETSPIKIQKTKDNRYFWQTRVKGKFGPRQYISESLALKLGFSE